MSGITQATLAGGVLLVLAGLRGRWPVAEPGRNHRTGRCAACVRAVAGLERGST